MNVEEMPLTESMGEVQAEKKETILQPNPYEQSQQTGFSSSKVSTEQSQATMNQMQVAGNAPINSENGPVMTRELEKINELSQKMNQFGVQHFGSQFYQKINQNTSLSHQIMMDPNMPQTKNPSESEKNIITVGFVLTIEHFLFRFEE